MIKVPEPDKESSQDCVELVKDLHALLDRYRSRLNFHEAMGCMQIVTTSLISAQSLSFTWVTAETPKE
jgi:hypothetical protein